MIVCCAGHHKLHHDGLLSIRGPADELVVERNGTVLVDSRSVSEATASSPVLRAAAASSVRPDSTASSSVRPAAARSRFDDVVKLEHAKRALMQLGFKARAARCALDEARAHVGGEADVATLVKAVLSATKSEDDADDVPDLAKRALIQLGYKATIAAPAVEAARAHVGASASLEIVIREALRRCG